MSVAEVAAWLRTTFAANASFAPVIDQYVAAFAENDIDGDGFLRDVLPVLDYDESQENVTTKTPTRCRCPSRFSSQLRRCRKCQ